MYHWLLGRALARKSPSTDIGAYAIIILISRLERGGRIANSAEYGAALSQGRAVRRGAHHLALGTGSNRCVAITRAAAAMSRALMIIPAASVPRRWTGTRTGARTSRTRDVPKAAERRYAIAVSLTRGTVPNEPVKWPAAIGELGAPVSTRDRREMRGQRRPRGWRNGWPVDRARTVADRRSGRSKVGIENIDC
jgi:hypothetical protein